jgi:hypothetical protein
VTRRRALLVAVGAAFLAALLVAPHALAEYRGTDIFSNVSPAAPNRGTGTLLDRHPPGYYTLDTHVDAGVARPGGLVALIPHFLAGQLWDLSKFLVMTTISLFGWAFSLDLLNGSGGHPGALAPVARAVEALHEHTFGRAWLLVGIVLAGLWGTWKALVQRRYTETLGQLAVSVAFVVLALWIVYQPNVTIARASTWTNEMSLAVLGGASGGDVTDTDEARNRVADHLFRTLVYEPWVVLNFGGLRHCVDGEHRPVPPGAPGSERCINHVRASEGRGGYAERFLRYPPGSGPRNAEYEAIRDGEIPELRDGILDGASVPGLPDLPDVPGLPGIPGLPVSLPGDPFLGTGDDSDPEPGQFDGYQVGEDDRPAVDIQQQAGGFQRLTMAALIFAADLGAVALLGSLALAVILAQILVLLFLAFAPLALVAGVFPGRGHELFRAWLGKLAGALVRKAFYSLVLAVVLAVSSALVAAADGLGWLLAFGLQAGFYWTIFLQRHSITAHLAGWRGGTSRQAHPRHLLPRRRTISTLIQTAARPLTNRPPNYTSPAGAYSSMRRSSGRAGTPSRHGPRRTGGRFPEDHRRNDRRADSHTGSAPDRSRPEPETSARSPVGRSRRGEAPDSASRPSRSMPPAGEKRRADAGRPARRPADVPAGESPLRHELEADAGRLSSRHDGPQGQTRQARRRRPTRFWRREG